MQTSSISGAPQLNLVYQPATTLKPYERNARTHSARQIRQIADSITAFGFTNPVLVDKKNMVIAGHGRIRAAQLLGMTDVLTICLGDLSEAQVRAYILADNKLAEKAGWDQSLLAIELQHLMAIDLGFDVTVTGFEVPEIDLLVSHTEARTEEEQPVEVATGPPVAQPGDLWALGRHRIPCGNSLLPDNLTACLRAIRQTQRSSILRTTWSLMVTPAGTARSNQRSPHTTL